MKRVKQFIMKNLQTLLFVTLLFLFLSLVLVIILNSFKTNESLITTKEQAPIHTGPSSRYPVLYNSLDGVKYEVRERSGRWVEIYSDEKNQSGWVEGYLTSLNLPKKETNHNYLKGKTIFVDAGHGGKDQGATSRSGKTHEKDLTLKTALMLKSQLEAKGAIVKMSRTDDTFIPLKERKAHADAMVSIHFDSLKDDFATGLTVIYKDAEHEDYAYTLFNSISNKSFLISREVVTNDELAVLKIAEQPAVLLELGFMSSDVDESMLVDKKYRHLAVSGIVDGLNAYFGA